MLREIAPEDDADLASKYMLHAEILLDGGCAVAALHHSREGLRRRRLTTADPVLLVDYHWVLARAQLAAGHEPGAALVLGREVGQIFRATNNTPKSEAVERWITARTGTPRLAVAHSEPSFCSAHHQVF